MKFSPKAPQPGDGLELQPGEDWCADCKHVVKAGHVHSQKVNDTWMEIHWL